MANRSSRFVDQETLTPGPGAYQLRNLEVNGKSKKQSIPEGRVRKLYHALVDICNVLAWVIPIVPTHTITQ